MVMIIDQDFFGMLDQEEIEKRIREHTLSEIARSLPQEIKYYVLINEGVTHIKGDEVVPEVPFMEILKRSGDAV